MEWYGQKTTGGKSRKLVFYGIVQVDTTTETVYGRVNDTTPHRLVKTHQSIKDAEDYFALKTTERLGLGYSEITTHHNPDLYTIASIQFGSDTDSLDEKATDTDKELLDSLDEACEGCCDGGCPACVLRDQILSSRECEPVSLPDPCPVCEIPTIDSSRLCERCERYHYRQWDDEWSHHSIARIQSLVRGYQVRQQDLIDQRRSQFLEFIPGLELVPKPDHVQAPLSSYNLIPGNPYTALLSSLLVAFCHECRSQPRSQPHFTFDLLQRLLYSIVPRDTIPKQHHSTLDRFLAIASHGTKSISTEMNRLVDFHLSCGTTRFELFHSGISNTAMETLTDRVWKHLHDTYPADLLRPLHPFNRLVYV